MTGALEGQWNPKQNGSSAGTDINFEHLIVVTFVGLLRYAPTLTPRVRPPADEPTQGIVHMQADVQLLLLGDGRLIQCQVILESRTPTSAGNSRRSDAFAAGQFTPLQQVLVNGAGPSAEAPSRLGRHRLAFRRRLGCSRSTPGTARSGVGRMARLSRRKSSTPLKRPIGAVTASSFSPFPRCVSPRMTVKRKAAVRPTLVSIAVPYAERSTATDRSSNHSGREPLSSPCADPFSVTGRSRPATFSRREFVAATGSAYGTFSR
jgi:hypothetical protein